MDVAIIGAGRLGTSLALALSKKGYSIKALSCRTQPSAQESRRIIGEGKALMDNVRAAKLGNLVILSLPDGEIARVAKELACSDICWDQKYVFHCSGLLPSTVLKPLKIRGALTASVHPIQSFSKKKTDPEHFKNIYFGLEGYDKALALARKMVQQLGGQPLVVRAKDKALYHAACSVASNFLVVLLDMAVSLLRLAGIDEGKALQVLLPLMQGTLHNVKKFDITSSLTGPVIRSDQESVQRHLRALKKFRSFEKTYRRLAAQTLEMAEKEKRLTSQDIRAMKNLLEGK